MKRQKSRGESVADLSGYTKITQTPSRKDKNNPGHFPDPIRTIFTQSAADDDAPINTKAVLGHPERAEMKRYVARAWKEMKMIMKDQRRAIAKKDAGQNPSRGKESPKQRTFSQQVLTHRASSIAKKEVAPSNKSSDNEKSRGK